MNACFGEREIKFMLVLLESMYIDINSIIGYNNNVVTSLIYTYIMPRSKKTRSSNKQPVFCERCQRSFSNIELHYEKSNICRDHALLDSSGLLLDPTLVCTVASATANRSEEYRNHISDSHFALRLQNQVDSRTKSTKKRKSQRNESTIYNNDFPMEQLMNKATDVATKPVAASLTENRKKFPSMDPELSNFYQSSTFDADICFEPDSTDPAYANLSERQLKDYFNSLIDKVDQEEDNESSDDVDRPGVEIIEMCISDDNDMTTAENQFSAVNDIHPDQEQTTIGVDVFIPSQSSSQPPATSNVTFPTQVPLNHNQLYEGTEEEIFHHLNVGCYADFRHVQSEILEKQINITIPETLVNGLKLLKLCSDSNIPNYLYQKISDWHEESMMCSMMDSMGFIQDSSLIASLRNDCDIPKDRKKVLRLLSDLIYGNANAIPVRPIHNAIQLPSRKWTRISRFDVKGVIYSLFSDPTLMTLDTCLFHDKYYRNPNLLSGIPLEERSYSDIHTGSWFLHAYNTICTHPRDILCPIILFIDGTPIDQYGHLSLEPVLMTLGIFNRTARNKASSWRLLGYIPEEELHVDNIVNENNVASEVLDIEALGEQAQKRVDYHHILSYLLQDIVELEKSNGILWNINRVSADTNTISSELVRFRFTVMFVIGDAPGLDKLCDRFANYNKNIRYLCRDCWCPTKELGNVERVCNMTERSHILTLDAKECLQKSYHKVRNNAFDQLILGNDKYGINGCVPPEILHQFLLGVIKKLTSTFYKCCTIKGLKFLDRVSKYISMHWHRNSSRDVPPIQMFKDGINSKKKFTGDEEISHLFILYLCLCQTYSLEQFVKIEQTSPARSSVLKTIVTKDVVTDSNGQPVLDVNGKEIIREEREILKKKFPKVGSTLKHAKKWLALFEYSLCFYYWVKSDSVPAADLAVNGNDAKCPADRSIQRYLSMYFELVNDDSGMDVNGLKLHHCKHIPHYQRRFGSCLNFDGSIGERNLKSMAKNPARRTQQRSSVLAHQATERYFESTTINLLHQILVGQGRIKSETTSSFGTTNNTNATEIYHVNGRYRVFFDSNGKVLETKWNNSKEKRIFHSEAFMKQVFMRLIKPDFKMSCNYIDCFTVLKVNNRDGSTTSFRADPYFFQKSWFDWCETKWEGHHDEYPSRLYMFIDPSAMVFNVADLDVDKGDYWAVTRCGARDNRKPDRISSRRNPTLYSLDSKLFDSFGLEDTVRIINCDTINSDLFVAPDISGEDIIDRYGRKQFSVEHIQKFKKVNEWGELFINAEW